VNIDAFGDQLTSCNRVCDECVITVSSINFSMYVTYNETGPSAEMSLNYGLLNNSSD